MQESRCPFCTIRDESSLLGESQPSLSMYDNFPVSRGHSLVIPKRHSTNYLEPTDEEKQDVWGLVDKVVMQLRELYKPDGFNIGFNIGRAAGQTVFHTYIHVIPRYINDCDIPNGGVRNSIPGKGKY
jgi:diadenosine tetraphosphate (Ap4A) HIT family hydrolase